LDSALEIDKVYIMNESGQFIESIPNGTMTSQRAQCPLCRSPVSQVQRYNRVIKRFVLDTLLKNIISLSHSQYLKLNTSFDKFKIELEENRDEWLDKLRPIRNETAKRPLSSKNGAVIVNRLKTFDSLKNEIRQYLKQVDESKQPHVKVYRMSIAAQSRANADVEGVPAVYWPSDVPSPDIKHRILGNILDYRLEVSRNAEIIQFVNRLSSLTGCKDDAAPLYRKVIKDCTTLRLILAKRKEECDERRYYSLAVEIILIQSELLTLAIRASVVVDKAKVQNLRDIGLQLLNSCEAYFRAYESCRKFKPAVARAREMQRVLGPFYEAVSQEERSIIYQAMRGNFGNSVQWYYCRNGHPVCHDII
jgi:hypothetical protein